MFSKLFLPAFLIIAFSQVWAQKQSAVVAFTVKEKDLIPEGIAYDPVAQNFFIGSINKHKIVRINRKGVVSDFVPADQQGLLEVLGMTVQVDQRRLWVCNNSPEHDTLNRISNIHVYDVKSGALLKKFQLQERSRHLFNDLVIIKNGDVYITDSEGGAVYVIKKNNESLMEFLKPGSLTYPNGITLSPDGKNLIVSTGSGLGIVKVNLETKQIESLRHSKYFLIGVDGLYQHNNHLIGIQNVTYPESVITLSLNDELTQVENVAHVVLNHDQFDTPTTGVVVNEDFYFIANSQLTQVIGNGGKIRNEAALKDVVIMKVKLPKITNRKVD